MDAATLRLNVVRLTDGRLAFAVVVQTQGGRRTWLRRLSPARPIGTPGAPPAGLDPVQWDLLYAAWFLAGQNMDDLFRAVRRPRAPGGATGAHQPNG